MKSQYSQTVIIIMIDLIKAATLTNNRQMQKNAENAILKHRLEQPDNFFIENSQILQNRDIETPIRQAAGALLAGSLKIKTNENYLWSTLSTPNRSAFKDVVLNTLLDREKSIRRAAANIVAAICCIEIPRNQWQGIAQKITANIRSEDLVVKEVSIMTIGFICQQLKDFNFFFQESLQEPILTAIILGLKDSHVEIAETAFKALRDGMPAFSSIMKNQQYRNYLLAQIAEALNAKKFLQLAIQSLIQFVKCYFSLLEKQYVEILAKFIDPIMLNTADQNQCILAMEYWNNFAKEQKNIESNPNLNKFITGALGQHLVEVLLQNLCVVEDDDQEGNGISETAASTLQSIFLQDSSEFQQKILLFTSNTIRHQNWKYKQASIKAFALLLIGLEPQRSQALVNMSLLELIALVNDNKQFVKLSAVKSLSLISEEVPEVIYKHENFLQILQLVIQVIPLGQQFLKNVCRIVDNLCSPQESVKYVGIHSGTLLKVFLQYCLNAKSTKATANSCLLTIINLIKCSRNNNICNEYITFVITTFPSIHGLEQQKRDIFYPGFFTIAQVCLITLRKINSSITMQQMSSLYNLVVQYYNKLGSVEGDGFYMVSALAYFIPHDLRLVEDFWKYIQQGLRKTTQDSVFRSTISCICDFASIYREQIAGKVEDVILYITELYEKNLITRELKLDVLMCIGEIFLQCGNICARHLPRIMDLLLISCEGVLTVGDLNYAEILQESIIETLMCIYHGAEDPESKKILAKSLGFVTEFIRITTDPTRHPKLDYVKNSIMLMGDIMTAMPNETGNLAKCTFVRERLATLIKFNKDGHLRQCIKFVSQQFRINI